MNADERGRTRKNAEAGNNPPRSSAFIRGPSPRENDREPRAESMTFEESLTRLEAIVNELESGDQLELDRALQLFEEGIERLREAAQELGRAEAGVKRLSETADGLFELDDHDA